MCHLSHSKFSSSSSYLPVRRFLKSSGSDSSKQSSCIHQASSSKSANSSFVVLTSPKLSRGARFMHLQHTLSPHPLTLPSFRTRRQTTPSRSFVTGFVHTRHTVPPM